MVDLMLLPGHFRRYDTHHLEQSRGAFLKATVLATHKAMEQMFPLLRLPALKTSSCLPVCQCLVLPIRPCSSSLHLAGSLLVHLQALGIYSGTSFITISWYEEALRKGGTGESELTLFSLFSSLSPLFLVPSLFLLFWARSHVALAGFKLTVQLRITLNFQFSCFWVLSHLIYSVLGTEPQALCMLSKHCTSWATFPDLICFH